MKKFTVSFTIGNVYAEDAYEAEQRAKKMINEAVGYAEEEDEDEIIDIMIGDLKEDVANEIIKANGCIGNYDIFPIAMIDNIDPEGNYETFVIAEIAGVKVTLDDLKPEVYETLGWTEKNN